MSYYPELWVWSVVNVHFTLWWWPIFIVLNFQWRHLAKYANYLINFFPLILLPCCLLFVLHFSYLLCSSTLQEENRVHYPVSLLRFTFKQNAEHLHRFVISEKQNNRTFFCYHVTPHSSKMNPYYFRKKWNHFSPWLLWLPSLTSHCFFPSDCMSGLKYPLPW